MHGDQAGRDGGTKKANSKEENEPLADLRSGQVRSGLLLGRSLGPWHEGQAKYTFESKQNDSERAQMSNELESDSAMVMNLESFGVDGAGYDETETAEPPSSTNPQ